MSAVAEVLERAADLLSKPGAWTQGAFVRNACGDVTGFSCFRGRPVSFCIMGATGWVCRDLDEFIDHDADDFLTEYLGTPLDKWNDAPGRTQAEVVEALRGAALRASRAGEG
jgi:hypothetical protein